GRALPRLNAEADGYSWSDGDRGLALQGTHGGNDREDGRRQPRRGPGRGGKDTNQEATVTHDELTLPLHDGSSIGHQVQARTLPVTPQSGAGRRYQSRCEEPCPLP